MSTKTKLLEVSHDFSTTKLQVTANRVVPTDNFQAREFDGRSESSQSVHWQIFKLYQPTIKEFTMFTRIFALAIITSSCTTLAPKPSVTILERSDDYTSKPAWASLDNATKIENGKKYFTVSFTIEGEDVSKSGALNASDEKAFAEPMRTLVDQYLDQNQVGEELRSSESVGTRVISATRGYRPPMPSLEVVNRYYETAVTTLPNGGYRYETRAFSRASVDVADYEKAKKLYFSRLKGTSEVQDILKDVGAKQREAVEAQYSAKE